MSRTKLRDGNSAGSQRENRKEGFVKKGNSQNATSPSKRKLDETESDRPAKKVATGRTDKQSSRPEQTEYNKVIGSESPEELASRFSTAIKKHKGELSTIELEDESVPATAFANTVDFAGPRVVSRLAEFLAHITPGGKQELSACQEVASPHTLLITFSAIRTTDLIRAVREYGTEDNKIAKLFTKHMKLPAMVEYVQKTRFGIGGGTPKRIKDLIEGDALKLEHLQRIVVDASYIDEKKNTILRDHDGFLQTLSLLNSEKLKLRFYSGKTKIVFF